LLHQFFKTQVKPIWLPELKDAKKEKLPISENLPNRLERFDVFVLHSTKCDQKEASR
jgi:hypothetical protein